MGSNQSVCSLFSTLQTDRLIRCYKVIHCTEYLVIATHLFSKMKSAMALSFLISCSRNYNFHVPASSLTPAYARLLSASFVSQGLIFLRVCLPTCIHISTGKQKTHTAVNEQKNFTLEMCVFAGHQSTGGSPGNQYFNTESEPAR